MGHETDHLPPSTAHVNNMELYLHSPYVFMAWSLLKNMIHLDGVVLSYAQEELYIPFYLCMFPLGSLLRDH